MGRRARCRPELAFWAALLAAVLVLGCALLGLIPPGAQDVPRGQAEGLRHMIGTAVVAAFLLVLAFALVLAVVLLQRASVEIETQSVCYLAVFIVLTAAWILVESDLPCATARACLTTRLVAYFTFSLAPVALLLLVRSLCRRGRRALHVLLCLSLLAYGVNFIWLVARAFLFPPTLWLAQALLALSMAACLITACVEYKHSPAAAVREFLLGVAAFAALSVCGLLFHTAYPQRGYLGFAVTGLLLFVLSLACGMFRQMSLACTRARGYEKTFAQTPVGICRTQADAWLTLTYANGSYYRLFGYTEQEAKTAGYSAATDFIRGDDRARVLESIRAAMREGQEEFEFEARRLHKSGRELWILSRCRYDAATDVITAALVDVTRLKKTEEQLRISEEEFRIAAQQGARLIARYELDTQTIYQRPEAAAVFGLAPVVEHVPESILAMGLVAPESEEKYRAFYRDMRQEKPKGEVTVRMRAIGQEEYRWYKGEYSLVYDTRGAAQCGIVSFFDYTALREKELAYEKWQQELATLPKEKTTLREWNLTRDAAEGEPLDAEYLDPRGVYGFDDGARAYAENLVHPEDRLAYLTLVNRERLLGAFGEDRSTVALEYRERQKDGAFHWMRLNVQMVQYPGSEEIKGYLIRRDIDEEKRARLGIERRAQLDLLTGVCNRASFIERAQETIAQNPDAQHAFIMLDLDGFKQVNDTLGHLEGDRLLADIARKLSSLLREGDTVGRTGGDEFMLCLRSVPYDDVIDKRAQLICSLLDISLTQNVSVSASIGIAMYPRDGSEFEALYQKADVAMYYAKQQGKNRYVFYRPDMRSIDCTVSGTPIDELTAGRQLEMQRETALVSKNERLLDRQEEEARYHLILRETGIVSYEWNLQTGVFYADPGFEQYVLGNQTPADLFCARADLSGVHPDDRSALEEGLIAPLRQGGRRAYTWIRLKKTDGTYEQSVISVFLVRDGQGVPQRVIGTVWGFPNGVPVPWA